MKSSAKKVELASVDDLFSTEEGRQDAKLEKIQEIPLRRIHFPLFDIGDLLYRNMAQIRKLLLCKSVSVSVIFDPSAYISVDRIRVHMYRSPP